MPSFSNFEISTPHNYRCCEIIYANYNTIIQLQTWMPSFSNFEISTPHNYRCCEIIYANYNTIIQLQTWMPSFSNFEISTPHNYRCCEIIYALYYNTIIQLQTWNSDLHIISCNFLLCTIIRAYASNFRCKFKILWKESKLYNIILWIIQFNTTL